MRSVPISHSITGPLARSIGLGCTGAEREKALTNAGGLSGPPLGVHYSHGVHHLSLALAALHLAEDQRQELYSRLRGLLRAGKSRVVLAALEALAAARARNEPVWREIGYLTRHSEAGRLRYDCFRNRGVPLGSGAIESTIRRVINLRLKGNSIYWTEGNAEAVFQLRAAVVSGRWEEIVEHTREAM